MAENAAFAFVITTAEKLNAVTLKVSQILIHIGRNGPEIFLLVATIDVERFLRKERTRSPQNAGKRIVSDVACLVTPEGCVVDPRVVVAFTVGCLWLGFTSAKTRRD